MNTTLLKIGGAVLASILFCGGLAYGGYHYANTEWQSKWDARDKADAEAQTLASEQARKSEQQGAINAAAIDNAYQQGASDAKSTASRTIASLRAGNLKLRKSLTCTASSVSVSSTNSAANVSDAAAACGLSSADAEFLIHFAQRADVVALQLKAAQSFIQTEHDRLMQAQSLRTSKNVSK